MYVWQMPKHKTKCNSPSQKRVTAKKSMVKEQKKNICVEKIEALESRRNANWRFYWWYNLIYYFCEVFTVKTWDQYIDRYQRMTLTEEGLQIFFIFSKWIISRCQWQHASDFFLTQPQASRYRERGLAC